MGTSEMLIGFSQTQRGRGLSEKTIQRRRVSLHSFTQFIQPTQATDVTWGVVDDWLMTFRSAATRRAYRSDLMMFYAWALKRNLVVTNPAAETESVRVPKGLPRPVPAEYLQPILASAPTAELERMCALAAMAGLRCIEIEQLDRSQIDLQAEVLVVRNGKGSKDRVVPLHPYLLDILRNLPAGPVVSVKAKRIGEKISTHLRSLGLDCTAHQLRHSFGTELARTADGNVVLVAKLMGHESTTTTMRYIGWSGGPGAQAIAAMFPQTAA